MRCSDPIALTAPTADHQPATAIPLTPVRAAAARKRILDNHDSRFVIKCFSVTLSGHTSLLCDLLSACWRDLTPELPPWKIIHISITNILTPYHHTRHNHACHITAGITVTASFLLSRISLYSLADDGFDRFESSVYQLHSYAQLLRIMYWYRHFWF